MTYYEKLRDPRWQKKRLKILEKNGFKCQACQDDETELHIHHFYYLKNTNPWDYPENSLWCLCKDCHKRIQEDTTSLLKMISEKPEDFIPWTLFYYLLEVEDIRNNNIKRINALVQLLVNIYPVPTTQKEKFTIETIKYLEKIKKLL